MQTFLPYADFAKSAKVLDRQRLGKQRVEAKQILLALEGGSGWKNHPAVKMWRGCEDGLALYGRAMCCEWKKRGYVDNLEPFFQERLTHLPGYVNVPWWLGGRAFHRSHKSNLVRKLPEHYGLLWPKVPNDLPYIWPV